MESCRTSVRRTCPFAGPIPFGFGGRGCFRGCSNRLSDVVELWRDKGFCKVVRLALGVYGRGLLGAVAENLDVGADEVERPERPE